MTDEKHIDLKHYASSIAAKLREIETLCRRHNNPSVVTSTQILAAKVLKIIEGEK